MLSCQVERRGSSTTPKYKSPTCHSNSVLTKLPQTSTLVSHDHILNFSSGVPTVYAWQCGVEVQDSKLSSTVQLQLLFNQLNSILISVYCCVQLSGYHHFQTRMPQPDSPVIWIFCTLSRANTAIIIFYLPHPCQLMYS